MPKIHAEIKISGIVQGVGFRPFAAKRAAQFCLCGRVRNTMHGVSLSVEGERVSIEDFLRSFRESAPPLSFIENIEVELSENLLGYKDFVIEDSVSDSHRRTLISPDIATCDDCLGELFGDGKRKNHPFINCTNCGPRFTIVRDIPYDRKNTTMAQFPMCDDCAEEYADLENRRYHAEPTCCNSCGPRLFFCNAEGEELSGDATELAQKYLSAGKIIAIKGIGGFHFACKTDGVCLVNSLRERKRRDERPFAIMCRDIEEAEKYAEINDAEKRLLSSPQRPIVLVKKKRRKENMHISENGCIGIMLPYTPVHHLLLSGDIKSLVMTSANFSDLPIVYKNEDALKKLSGIADGFLLNDREIHIRCDDSLLWEFCGNPYFARRSRGYCPYPVTAKRELPRILACGAEQKASFCLARENHIFPSQHIGDLKNLESLENFEEQIKHFENILDIKPRAIVCDLHPDYLSTQYAEERAKREKLPLYRVWHHHAHMASCMADNGITDDCIGVVFDGTGLSPEGEICGAEILVGGYKKVQHCATMRPIPLAGGDVAVKDVSRIGIALLNEAGLSAQEIFGEGAEEITKLLQSGINCPSSSGMGRLFDGVSAMLGIKRRVTYEGQAAILLEAEAEERISRVYPYTVDNTSSKLVFDWRKTVRAIARDLGDGVRVGEIAATFMNTLIECTAETVGLIASSHNIKRVVLSGGTFQNMYLLKGLTSRLSNMCFEVYTHKRVSTNDEGLSLGQIMIAAEGGGEYVSCDTARNSRD